jgi:DNA excision repair protein ERCC-2
VAGEGRDAVEASGRTDAETDTGTESGADGDGETPASEYEYEYERYFPYDQPYDNQRAAMERIATALAGGREVLFEGATGTGKTLAALAPALAHADRTGRTVVITTNVHQQTRQFVREARAITETEPIRAVVFRGKGSMCHIDVGYEECRTLRDTTRDLVDAQRDRRELSERADELQADGGDTAQSADAAEAYAAVVDELDGLEDEIAELEAANTCERYYNNLTDEGAVAAFRSWLHEDVRTPEEVYEYAHAQDLCGYELLKDGMDDVDLAVCNYHHLLDPAIREQFFRWLDCDPEDVVVVFDEAHNVPSAARDHASRQLTEQTLDAAVDELDGVEDPRADRAENVVRAFRAALRKVCTDADVSAGEEWRDVPVANETGRDDLTLRFLRAYTGRGIEGDVEAAADLAEELEAQYERAYRRGEADVRRECPTGTVAEFVGEWVTADGRHPVAAVRRGADGPVGRAELYTCIPRRVTGSLFEDVHAAVLMSATLQPFDVAGDVLGLEDPETMAFGSPFPPENRRTLAVDTPPLFASRRADPEVVRAVAGALEDTVRFTPGNTLVFFPSYGEADRYADRIDVDGPVYRDRAGVRATDLREEFAAEDDAVLLTSLWGTLAEGVSFDGDDAHTVAVVGVPYPRIDDRAEAVQAAYRELASEGAVGGGGSGDVGWRYAVEIPTVRKTRQALGRVVRGPEEVGARVLLDRRYTAAARAEMGDYSVRETFPETEREAMVDVEPEKLRFALLNFFSGHDRYDGTPPTP